MKADLKAIDFSPLQPAEYLIILNSDEKEYISLNYSLFPKEEAEQLFRKLKEFNPDIKIEKNAKKLLYMDKKLKIDFSTEESIFVRDAMSRVANPVLDTTLGLLSVLILIGCIVVPIILVPIYFQTNVGIKTVMFCISSFGFGFALVNLFAALLSAYLGHFITKIALACGVVFFILGIMI